jgi:hypothetical protein
MSRKIMKTTKEDDDKGDDDNDTDDDEEEGIFDFDLNGMSKYELLRLQRVHRNNARLVSLGLLEVKTSMAYPSANRTNRKKRVATQVDFVRRIQPKRNVFKPTSYKDLDDPVISKRTHSIDSSDTGEEDTGSKRMDKDEESCEFNSHILQMSLLSISDSQPLNPCKRRSSSPR